MLVPSEWPDARVVVIDDDPLVRSMLVEVLAAGGYTDVRTFADAAEALAHIERATPDLVLLDLHLPGMDGTELLRRLPTLPIEQRAPVLVLTGGGSVDDAHRTLQLGAVDFLRKPVDATELLLRVRHQLRERRLRHDLAAHNERLHDLVEARAGELSLLSKVLDQMPLAALVFGRDRRLRFANTRAVRWLEVAPPEQLGRLVADDGGRAALHGFLSTLRPGGALRTPWALPGAACDGGHRVELEAQLVEGSTVVVVHDVEERERATEALQRALHHERQAHERLRGVERLRSNFLTAVSHELRTPLTSVLGMTESLRRHGGQLSEAARHELVDRAYANAHRLGTLLEDLLDLQRLAEDQLSLQRAPHDLAEIADAALGEVEPDDHEVVVDLEPVRVQADAPRLRRVVVNLVRNAMVHTPPGTPIEVRTRRRGLVGRLEVRDRGPGVAAELRERIFERFEQGPTAPAHRPGTGIGLSLVREFVRLHDGRTWVEDTPGGGATFVVELPVVRPDRGLEVLAG